MIISSALHILCVSDSEGDALSSIGYFPSGMQIRYTSLYYNRETLEINGNNADDEVRRFCESNKVDLIITIPQPHVDVVCNFKWISDLHKKIPVVIMWYDANVYADKVREMSQFGTQIVLDDHHFKCDNVLPLWTPLPVTPGFPEDKRDIDVYFTGKIDDHQRVDVINFLLEEGVPLQVTGSNDWNKVSFCAMYSNMRRAKLVINFSANRLGSGHHFKGRVLEAMMSGAMVLESENDQTTMYFEPGKDFIMWDTKEDLLLKIRYYLLNEQERRNIATNGQNKCISELNIKKWWRLVFDKAIKQKNRPYGAVPIYC